MCTMWSLCAHQDYQAQIKIIKLLHKDTNLLVQQGNGKPNFYSVLFKIYVKRISKNYITQLWKRGSA